MKTWSEPIVEELNINETAHNWTGIYRDGGYIGDGVISGHLSWEKPEEKPTTPTTPTTPVDSLS